MAESKYEKYVVRKALRPQEFYHKEATGITNPPMVFLNGDEPIKGTNQFIEAGWTWAPRKADTPHAHNFDEIFIWIGTNLEDPDDLGGEVEMTLGEGEEAEKITIESSALVYVPKGVVHQPTTVKRVDRPFLVVTIGLNSGKWVRSKIIKEDPK
jgi:hypothetical protein